MLYKDSKGNVKVSLFLTVTKFSYRFPRDLFIPTQS